MNIQTVIAMHVFTLGNKKKQTTNTSSDTNLQNKILSEKKARHTYVKIMQYVPECWKCCFILGDDCVDA